MTNFLQVAISGLLLGGIYALISIGLTLIFGVVRIINFAHGELLMLAMYLSFWLFQLYGLDPYASIPLVALVLFVVGALIQRLLLQPILGASALMHIFATVGLSVALQNLALMLWKADYRTVKTPYSTAVLSVAGVSVSVPRLVAFAVAMVLVLGFFVWLRYTFMGKALRSLAEDRDAAALMGVDVHRAYILAFGLGAALVGVAGALLMPVFYVFPTVGTLFTLTAFVVVVLGGMGNMVGALAGGLFIGLVEAFSGAYLSPSLKEAIYFLIFIAILLLRPQGLFGLAKGAEEVGLK